MRDPAYEKLTFILHGKMFDGQMAVTPGIVSLDLFGWVQTANPEPRNALAVAMGLVDR